MPVTTAPVISPTRHRAVIVDLDDVVADTAAVRAAAWQRLFDDFLAHRPPGPGEDRSAFTHAEFREHLHGRSRYEGVTALLHARRIYLPAGGPYDFPQRPTRHGLANREDQYVAAELRTSGPRVFPAAAALLRRLREENVPVAVVSASRLCGQMLASAGLTDLFAARVDGVTAAELELPGKPDPAMFAEAARRLGVPPAEAVAVEDAGPGALAGQRGGFGLVIGVARADHSGELRASGADVLVNDLSEVRVTEADGGQGRRDEPTLFQLPDALAEWQQALAPRLARRRIAVFCDFDGTLAPIVPHPEAAVLAPGMRAVLSRLARHCPVAVISGRDLTDVRTRVGLGALWYAGGHGVELAGPHGEHEVIAAAEAARPTLSQANAELAERLADLPEAYLERKRFSLSVHYRNVDPSRAAEVTDAVAEVAARHPNLVVLSGRKVAELQPDIDWDKGQALRWLLERLGPGPGVFPVYAGDDITDEYALQEIADTGLGIVLRSEEHGDRPTAAHVAVADPAALCRLLNRIADLLDRQA